MRNFLYANKFYKLFAVITLVANPVVNSQVIPADPSSTGSIKLLYNYPADKPLKYLYITKVVQNMDVNAKIIKVNVSSYLVCDIKASSNQAENVRLEIRIDSMAHNVDSPQGTSGGEIAEARDKSFSVVINPQGKTIDLSEAAKITFTSPGSSGGDASETFLNYFPVLPDHGIRVGDKWVTHDTISSKSKTMSRWMPVESDCTFESVEDYEGIDCAKIATVISGVMKMTTQSQGMEISTSGVYTGAKTLHFALKEGYFVNEITSIKLKGTVEIPGQNISFPVVMEINSTNELVK